MLHRSIRLLALAGVLVLPSCIVVTCGETRAFRTGGAETRSAPGDTAHPARPDTASTAW